MTSNDDDRIRLRREAYDLKEQVISLLIEVTPVDLMAAEALVCARSALFEAWTLLCLPPDGDDDHDH